MNAAFFNFFVSFVLSHNEKFKIINTIPVIIIRAFKSVNMIYIYCFFGHILSLISVRSLPVRTVWTYSKRVNQKLPPSGGWGATNSPSLFATTIVAMPFPIKLVMGPCFAHEPVDT